ncbi:radical SAM family heme chaperone HemW [Methylomonas sp. MO1]|uniref:radical SAM family heme chaperone HemW n=1 Tax=Methylomonas sp. MO1 TaxID=3073619 RepID=UPI0028A4963E|nr:radical SAM family heme chaperone HemW [Methylomonas sp. MO1]MDT4289212.1 radical SAM family heme chaperone HemW [Methylomonas sp. MO1]
MGVHGECRRVVRSAELLPLSLYIHFPWCIQKCPYCDFNSHAVKNPIPEQAYIDALLTDLYADLELLGGQRSINSIFMGGGTPSLFSPEALDRLLAGVRQSVIVDEQCEITLEANPGTFESAKFHEFRALGINRLSIGIQSFQDRHLRTLGRVHSAAEAMAAVDIAGKAGFDNFNLDLMFGLPDQSESEALSDVEIAISLAPTHISFYQLTLEPNTYFYKFPPKLPEDDVIFAAQKRCQQLLAENGYQQYEVSAYAKPGKQSRHNRNYWQFGDYLGIGAGAHGKISRALPDEIMRTIKPRSPEQYLSQPGRSQCEAIEVAQLPLEFLMNQLRLKKGFSLKDFELTTGLAADSLEPNLSRCLAQGLLHRDGLVYSCSEKGWDFLDVVLEKFID